MRRSGLLISLLVGLVVGVGASPSALAAPITARFEGTITYFHDPFELLDDPIEVGVPFTISYTFDPDVFVTYYWWQSCRTDFGCDKCIYPFGPPFGHAFVEIDGVVNTASDFTVEIYDYPTDIWRLDLSLETPSMMATLWFTDTTGTRLPNADFVVNDTLEGWTEVHFVLFWGTIFAAVGEPAKNGCASGTIIPEPTSLALLLPALVVVVMGSRLHRYRRGVRLIAPLAIVGLAFGILAQPIEAGLLDTDADGVPDVWDNCPTVPNVDQADFDGDGPGDACDNCKDEPNAQVSLPPPCHRTTGGQVDDDLDGHGNACDRDLDASGFVNATDLLRFLEVFGEDVCTVGCPNDDGSPTSPCARYDLTGSGPFINIHDLLLMIWGGGWMPDWIPGCGLADDGLVHCPLECEAGEGALPCP